MPLIPHPNSKISGSISDPIDLTRAELQDIQEYLNYLTQLKTEEGFRDLFQKKRCHLLCSHCNLVDDDESERNQNVWSQRKTKFCTLMRKLMTTKTTAYALLFASLSVLLVSCFLEAWDQSSENPESQ